MLETFFELPVSMDVSRVLFLFQAEDGIRDYCVTGVQTCALPFSSRRRHTRSLCDWSSDVCSSDLFADAQAYLRFAEAAQASDDPLHHAVIDLATGRAIGSLALMRVDTASGVMEVGFVCYSRQLKRTRAATEAQFLLMQRAFDELGYRRYD